MGLYELFTPVSKLNNYQKIGRDLLVTALDSFWVMLGRKRFTKNLTACKVCNLITFICLSCSGVHCGLINRTLNESCIFLNDNHICLCHGITKRTERKQIRCSFKHFNIFFHSHLKSELKAAANWSYHSFWRLSGGCPGG